MSGKRSSIKQVSRRGFLAGAAATVAGSSASLGAGDETNQPPADATPKLPMRPLGQTGVKVSILGLGGGGRGGNPQIRGTPQHPEIQEQAEQILNRALDAGVNYIDTCAGYGESERIIGNVAATRRKEMFLATKCDRCNASGDQLRKELEQSLQRLQTDTIDLWQVHNIVNLRHVDTIFEEGRAIDVLFKAKEERIARFVGITVHASRAVIEATFERCRQRGIAMDALLMAFNVADASKGGYGRKVLDAHPSIGKIAMKVFASDGAPIVHHEGIPARAALRYVLSHGFATAIVGTHNLEELEENIETVRGFEPYSEEELRELEGRVGRSGGGLWTLQG
ncbi:MAG: aldo/keto reductase [Planctomycetota bacterium]